MKIELIHPGHPRATEDRLDVPLGLLYIASILEKFGHQVKISDLSGMRKENWNIGFADIYGITTYVTSLNEVYEIVKICRQINKEAKVIVGGAHPTSLPDGISQTVDVVVIGEGELPMLDIIKDYPNNKRYYEKPLEKNLDLYPNPAYHLVDLSTYKREINYKKSLTIVTSRGCPYNCATCGLSKEHKIVKFRSVKSVIDEIIHLKKTYGIEAYNFQDDTFTINKKRLYGLLESLKPLNIIFRCHGRAGLDTKKDYIKLKEAGCVAIAIGIESGSQKILDKMNKKVTVEQNKNAIKWAKEAGLLVRAFIIIGFPGETWETISETKKFIEETSPEHYFVSNFIPFPNTDVWKNPKKYGVTWLNKNFDDYYQVDKTGFGGINIETDVLSRKEFRKIEEDFRSWIKIHNKRRGYLLDYEKKMEL
jgi:radical SAM superfamily enzyme YgiQ (UPF0313 family)